jgi:hypothetical protein
VAAVSPNRHGFFTVLSCGPPNLLRLTAIDQPEDTTMTQLIDFNDENSNTSDNPSFDSVLQAA